MEKLQKIKEAVAKENGFITWSELEAKFDKKMLSYAWQDVCKDYSREWKRGPVLKALQGFVDEFEENYLIDGEIVDDPDFLLVMSYNKFKQLIQEATT